MAIPPQTYQLQRFQLETALSLLDERVASIQSAINNHTQVDTFAITKSLLASKGYQYNTAELKEQISSMAQRRLAILAECEGDDVTSALSDEKDSVSNEIDAEIEHVRIAYRQKITLLENESRAKTSEIKATTSVRIAALEQKINDRENEIVNQHEPGLSEDLKAKELEFPVLKRIEESLRSEVEKKADLVRQMRSALRSLVQDRVLSTKAHFTDCAAKGDSLDIENSLKKLPDVSSMLNAMADPTELQKIVAELSPSGDGFTRLAIEAPSF